MARRQACASAVSLGGLSGLTGTGFCFEGGIVRDPRPSSNVRRQRTAAGRELGGDEGGGMTSIVGAPSMPTPRASVLLRPLTGGEAGGGR